MDVDVTFVVVVVFLAYIKKQEINEKMLVYLQYMWRPWKLLTKRNKATGGATWSLDICTNS